MLLCLHLMNLKFINILLVQSQDLHQRRVEYFMSPLELAEKVRVIVREGLMNEGFELPS